MSGAMEGYRRSLLSVDVDVAMAHVFEVFTEAAHGEYTEADLKNVYLFGSRLYGVASPDADYDLICVVDGEYFHGSDVPLSFFFILFDKKSELFPIDRGISIFTSKVLKEVS